MATLPLQKIYCITEGVFVYKASNAPLTACPVNSEHRVDLNTAFVDTLPMPTRTRGYFMLDTSTFNVPGSTTASYDFSRKIDISVVNVTHITATAGTDDEGWVIRNPGTSAGVITQNVAASDTLLYLLPGVAAQLWTGFFVRLSNGVTEEDMGYIYEINSTDSTIRTTSHSTRAYTALAATVKIDMYVVRPIVISGMEKTVSMGTGVSGAWVPKNTILRLYYKNNSGSAKDVVFRWAYFY